MAKNVFVRATVLKNARGRLAYISSPDKQEHLEAYVSNMPKGGWKELSEYTRQQAALYHPGEGWCEARELIYMLPNELSSKDPKQLAIKIRNDFSEKYKVPCALAIHWNKEENNFHAHVLFPERSIYRQPQGRSIATRDTYFDANGKRSTKKACVDESGQLLPGCRLVKKGEALKEGSRFGPKKNIFAQEEWLRAEKQRMADFYNQLERGKGWKVYDWKKDPHFPMLRIVKGDPPALNAWRERENEWRQHYNTSIDRLISDGSLTPEEALKLKLKTMEQRSRLRRERAASRRLWFEQYSQIRDRSRAEWEYSRELKKKGLLGLTIELALLCAGVDVVKLHTGVASVETEEPRPIIAYRDWKVQNMIDDLYRSVGKETPSERLLRHAAEGNVEARILANELEKERVDQEKSKERERPADLERL